MCVRERESKQGGGRERLKDCIQISKCMALLVGRADILQNFAYLKEINNNRVISLFMKAPGNAGCFLVVIERVVRVLNVATLCHL